jgi:hypothetical protein
LFSCLDLRCTSDVWYSKILFPVSMSRNETALWHDQAFNYQNMVNSNRGAPPIHFAGIRVTRKSGLQRARHSHLDCSPTDRHNGNPHHIVLLQIIKLGR